MIVSYQVLHASGGMQRVTLDQCLVSKLAVLPDEPSMYFEERPSMFLVPLAKLINSRARPKGIVNANGFMTKALTGEVPHEHRLVFLGTMTSTG